MNERLLEINEEGLPECACCIYPEYQGKCNECQMHVDVAVKLCEYEQAEDDGLLVRLPCKVGDTVYSNNSIAGWYMRKKDRPYKAKVIFIGINGVTNFMNVEYDSGRQLQFKFSDIGETVFLTLEEAERALKEAQENA